MVIPSKFYPKNYRSKLRFDEKKLSIPDRGFRFSLKIAKTTILRCRTEFFFYFQKKVHHSVFWGEIYRRLP